MMLRWAACNNSSALRDFKVQEASTRRHMVRITPQAERPYFEE